MSMARQKNLQKFSRHDGFPLLPKLLATSFGAGFLPVAPGTWGSLVAIALWIPLYIWASPSATVIITISAAILYFIVGTWASNQAEKYWGKDPVVACADETVGQWIALIPVTSLCPWWEILISFALFRIFDIFKPLGIRYMEKIPGGFGMMADDILAGIYAAILIFVLNIAI